MRHRRDTGKWQLGALVAFSGFCTLVLIDVIWRARLLRPIADDYASAATIVDKGLVGYVISNYQAFSGEAARALSDAILVGVPLTYLPWSIASSITFLLALLCVVSAMLILLLGTKYSKSVGWVWLASGPILAVAWWSFWWVPVTDSTSTLQRALAESITHWQIINSSYVILPLLFLISWMFLSKQSSRIGILTFGFSLLGLVVGLSGPVLGITLVISSSLLTLLPRRPAAPYLVPARFSLMWVIIGTGFGLAISQLSPGTRLRAGIFEPKNREVPLTFGNLLNWTIPPGLFEWWNLAFSVGTLVLLGLTAGLGGLLYANGMRIDVMKLIKASLGLMVFSVIYAVINRLSEAFAYRAFWHQVGFGTMLAVSLAALGLGAGFFLASRASATISVVLALALLISLLWALSAERLLIGSIQNRYQAWISGAAPLPGGMPDIENPNTWVPKAWQVLALRRGDAPDRGETVRP